MPADLMRGAMMKIKSEERDRLAAILADLEQQNDALRYALGSQIWGLGISWLRFWLSSDSVTGMHPDHSQAHMCMLTYFPHHETLWSARIDSHMLVFVRTHNTQTHVHTYLRTCMHKIHTNAPNMSTCRHVRASSMK